MRSIATVVFLSTLMLVGGSAFAQSSRPATAEYYSTHQGIWFALSTDKIFMPTSRGPMADSGIKEVVPRRFQSRYERWKSELLATTAGRDLWNQYANHPGFTLKIVVTDEKKSGAGTDEYKWNDQGELIGATIVLGGNLDRGFPDPIYYPVMNSLAMATNTANFSGNLLASTKIAHELGHVKFTARSNGKVFQRQSKLIANYYSIFLRNGHNTSDPRLLAIVDELGARPIEIWEDREYWSEVAALGFLVERMDSDVSLCALLRKIKSNLNNYAAAYKGRFEELYGAETLRYCGS